MKPVLVIYVILSAWEVGGSDSEYSSCKPLVGLRIWYWGSRFWGLGVRIWGIFWGFGCWIFCAAGLRVQRSGVRLAGNA